MNGVSFKNLNTPQLNGTYSTFIKNDQYLSYPEDVYTPKNDKQHSKEDKLSHIKILGISGSILVLSLLLFFTGKNTNQILEKLTNQQKNILEAIEKTDSPIAKGFLKVKENLTKLLAIKFELHQQLNFAIKQKLDKFKPTKFLMEKWNNIFASMATNAVKQKYSTINNIGRQLDKHIEEYIKSLPKDDPHIAQIKELRERMNKNIGEYVTDFDKLGSGRLKKIEDKIEEWTNKYETTPFQLKNCTQITSREIIGKEPENNERLIENQKILEELGKIINNDSSGRNVQKSIKKFSDSIKNAANLEKEMKNILFDITLGDKITEITGIAIPLIFVGHNINKEKTKEQKISKSIKEGIPTTAAIGAAIYAASKCINGVNALIFTVIVGTIFEDLGKYLSKKYMKMQKAHDHSVLKQ